MAGQFISAKRTDSLTSYPAIPLPPLSNSLSDRSLTFLPPLDRHSCESVDKGCRRDESGMNPACTGNNADSAGFEWDFQSDPIDIRFVQKVIK